MGGARVGECIPYINLHTIFDCACDFLSSSLCPRR